MRRLLRPPWPLQPGGSAPAGGGKQHRACPTALRSGAGTTGPCWQPGPAPGRLCDPSEIQLTGGATSARLDRTPWVPMRLFCHRVPACYSLIGRDVILQPIGL